MIERIEYQRNDTRRTIKCGPLNVFVGSSGTGKTENLKALKQAFTKEGNCEKVKISIDNGSFIETQNDGSFQLYSKHSGSIVPDGFARIRRSNPDCVFDPHILLGQTQQVALKADVERRLLSELPDIELQQALIPESEFAEYRKDPLAYLSARAKPQNEAETNRLRVRLADMENYRRMRDALTEVEELMKPFEDAPDVSSEEIKKQNEAIYAAEENFRNAGSDPDRRRALYAELVRNKDLGDELRRTKQRASEKKQLELRRGSILSIMSHCRQNFDPDINRAIEDTIAEINALERSATQIDNPRLYAAINKQGWYPTPIPNCAIAVGDGIATAKEQAGEINYKSRPLRDYGKSLQTRVLFALVKWLYPKASVLVLDDMESLGVPDGVADFLTKLSKSDRPIQFFGALTLDDKNNQLKEFKSFLEQFIPEVSHV